MLSINGPHEMYFWLFAMHFLCDYPLQGDFLARAKNHNAPLPGAPWYQALIAHAFIQGAGVALVTGSITLGLCEITAHAVIDYSKSDGWFGFDMDQCLHLGCKLVWVFMLLLS